ncbi:hypothetical protein C8J56DRAFT_215186 [Mycena floridula]|nr:hypothetical protein C8J56DRAFT_215186 [Mycena floridula]
MALVPSSPLEAKSKKFRHPSPETRIPSTITRKRKRAASSSSDNEVSPEVNVASGSRSRRGRHRKDSSVDSDAGISDESRRSDNKLYSTRRSQPKRRRAPSQDQSESPEPRFHRAMSHFHPPPPSDPFYPYPPDLGAHGYAHLPDPRLQMIVSNAVQQIYSLSASLYPAQPITPTHRHRQTSVFHTPQHYPYLPYDPTYSKGTLPPSSPEGDSSSPVRREPIHRAASLVQRSRSRGRTVSFDVDNLSTRAGAASSSPPRERRRKSQAVIPGSPEVPLPPKSTRRKQKPIEVISDSESERELQTRGRSFVRAQTPAPVDRSSSPVSRVEQRPRKNAQKPTAPPKGRAKSLIQKPS